MCSAGSLSDLSPPRLPAPLLTAEAKQYLGNLELSNVHMQAAESYVQARLVEILGDIKNNGTRNLKVVEVNCVFRDYAGEVIAREPALVVGGRSGSLAPGQTKPFRLPFDNIRIPGTRHCRPWSSHRFSSNNLSQVGQVVDLRPIGNRPPRVCTNLYWTGEQSVFDGARLRGFITCPSPR